MFAKISKQGPNKNVGEVPNDVNNSFTANNWQLGKFRMDASLPKGHYIIEWVLRSHLSERKLVSLNHR